MSNRTRAVKFRDVVKALTKHGFSEQSGKQTRHRKFKKDGHPTHVIVSGKDSKDVGKFILKSIKHQSGLSNSCLNDTCSCFDAVPEPTT